MKHNPFVSFIVPTRDEEQMIGPCLDAINRIQYDPRLFECIVVDNGSVDNTTEIARVKGAKVFELPGVTISALRNFGAKEARGDFLAFIDADCVVDRDWLGNALLHFKDSKVGCVGSYPVLPEKSSWVQRAWMLQIQTGKLVEEVRWLPSMNILVKRKAFEEAEGFNESLTTCEDVDFCYRLKEKGYRIVSDKSVRSVHFGEASTLREFVSKERWRGQSNLWGVLSHGLYLEELPSVTLPIFYLVALLALPFTLIHGLAKPSYLPFLFNLGFILTPPLLLSLRTSFKVGDFSCFHKLAFLYLIYSLARTASIFHVGS